MKLKEAPEKRKVKVAYSSACHRNKHRFQKTTEETATAEAAAMALVHHPQPPPQQDEEALRPTVPKGCKVVGYSRFGFSS